jgi:nucleoside-diphosphate-sugar epimerase
MSVYAVTKLATENYLRVYGKINGVPVTILRYSTVYGPGELGHRAIPNFIQAVMAGQSPVIHGDGSEIRDYVFIDDVVKATVSAILLRPDQTLNIGSGKGYTVKQIAEKIGSLLASDLKPEYVPLERKNYNMICDISAAGRALDFTPDTDIDKGLAQDW